MTHRTTTVLAAVTLSAAALLATPATGAQAETALPTGVPTVKSLGLTSAVRDMVIADGRVWVSTGNEVDVFSTAGAKLATLTGMLGASGLLASADGSQVYVALSGDARIVTLDAASMAQTASWVSSPCPTHLALAAGRLFYSYGCTEFSGAISSLSVADGSAGPVAATGTYTPDLLAGAGNVLASQVTGLSPAALNTYSANADGSVTALAADSQAVGGSDLALSPDGKQVVLISSSKAYRYQTADLSTAGTFDTATYPVAVGYAPDGSGFAVGLSTSYSDMLRVFDAGTGVMTSHTADTSKGLNPSLLGGTLNYSADGTRIYAIAQDSVNTVARLVTATAQTVGASKISATVTSPKLNGKPVSVKVSTPGRAHAPVTVTVTAVNTPAKVYHATSNAAGSVTVPVSPKFSGTLTVTAAGDLRHSSATTPTKRYTVPAKLGIKVGNAYSTSGGVAHFHKPTDIQLTILATPKRALTYTAKLQLKSGPTWRDAATGSSSTDATGADYLTLTANSSKHVRFRMVVSFTGDAYNSKAPSVTSKQFIID